MKAKEEVKTSFFKNTKVVHYLIVDYFNM